MKLQISQLLEAPGREKEFDFLLPQEAVPQEEYQLLTPLRVRGKVTNTGNGIRLSGSLKTRIRGLCCRCLSPVTQDFQSDFEESYEYGELTGEAVLDLAEAAGQYLTLSLPLRLLCRQDCPGLCPVCGKPLADGGCDCIKETGDPRLAALRKLLD